MTAGAADDAAARGRFEALFVEHGAFLLRYARRRCASLADAEDAVSETFVVAWRKVHDVPDDDAARGWLIGVCRRVIANQRRGARRRTRLLERIRNLLPRRSVEAMGEPETPALAALASLSEDDQELLRLVAWDQVPYRQIGLALGIEPSTVAVRVHRARQRFRAALEEPGNVRAASGHSIGEPQPEARTSDPDGRTPRSH